MTARDILERAGYARRRLRDVDTELALMRSRIGVQGHGFEAHAKDAILDPSRRVLSLIEATEDTDAERVGLQADTEDAMQFLRGVARAVSKQLAAILEYYYLDGLTPPTIARRMHYPRELVEGAIQCAPDELSPLLPKLMQLGKG